MKVAICTTNGSEVDLHFGKTSTFYIYEIKNGVKELLEKRDTEKYSPVEAFLKDTGEQHDFSKQKFDSAYNTISDCRKLYTVSIGDVPKEKLGEKGIEVKLCNCPVESIPTCDGKCK